jgi:hypothetical protein
MSTEDKKMTKCTAINHPSIEGWGCHECRTMNGNNRSNCKTCNHARCDNPDVIRVPIKEAGGIRIVPVKQGNDPQKAN